MKKENLEAIIYYVVMNSLCATAYDERGIFTRDPYTVVKYVVQYWNEDEGYYDIEYTPEEAFDEAVQQCKDTMILGF